jgi:hypothetical protein
MSDDKKQTLRLGNEAVTSTVTATTAFQLEPSFWRVDPLPVKPPEPNNPIYSYVGQIASAWAHVEHTLDTIIWELANIDAEYGACITAQMMGAYGRFKAIISELNVFQRKSNKSTAQLVVKATELMNKCSGSGEKRNRVVHDPWYDYTPYDRTAQFKAVPFKDFSYGIHEVDQTELVETLDQIKKFSERVINFRSEILAFLSASR